MLEERKAVNLIECFNFDPRKYDSLAKKMLRPSLYGILEQSRLIQRFKGLGLPEALIKRETVRIHVLRLACRIESLPISSEKKSKSLRTVFGHDLPETWILLESGKTSDVTATEKALSPDLDQDIESTEDRVAERIFNDQELKLYQEYSQASNYLKGYTEEPIPTAVALICKILDKIDADLFFHWAASRGLDDLGNLSKKGQSLAFEQYLTFSERLNSLSQTEVAVAANLCQDLLNDCMDSIKEIWSQVPEDKIPPIIRGCLTKLQVP